MTLAKLVSQPPEPLASLVDGLKRLFNQNQKVARDPNRTVADRAAAVEFLAYQPFAEVSPAFEELLSNDQPVGVQTACIDALSKNGSIAAAKIVLDRWSELGPAVRGTALNLVMRRVDSTRLALDAMTS